MNPTTGRSRRALSVGLWGALPLLFACGGSNDADARAFVDASIPGVEVHHRQPPDVGAGLSAAPVTLVHIDPARFELQLFTEARDGKARTVESWVRDHSLAGAINASMYLPNLRSTGYMIDRGHVNNPAVNPRFGGFLAFGPQREGIAPVVLVGTECDDYDLEALRRDYATLVQNYRLLDCEGGAIPWEDRKLYSSAAIGLDRRGWVVFVHSGGPVRMSDFANWLASEEWGLVAAHFVEGGTDASLLIEIDELSVRQIGSYEGGFGGNQFRPLPNVIGFRPR